MSTDASPPQQPPQMSPDGQWVWNGAEWLPVGTHRSVFPNWNGLRVEPAQAVAEPPQAVMMQPQPVFSYPVYAPAVADVAAPPLWERRSNGMNKYLYVVAGVIVLVVAFVLLRAMAPFIVWPWDSVPEVTRAATPLPPLATRTDYARSDRFIAASLTPAISALAPTVPVVAETCIGPLTMSCQNAIAATDKQVKAALAAIDGATIPACIAKPVSKLRADLAASDVALQFALKGYTDNSQAEVATGVSSFKRTNAPVAADALAVGPAQRLCDTQVVGP